MNDTNLVINLGELKEHPEKLVEVLKIFDIEAIFMAFKEVIKDYVYADISNRSIFCSFETDNALIGMLGGNRSNIVNALMSEAEDHPEILDIVSAVQKLKDSEKTDSEKIVINPNTKHLS